MAIVGFDNLFPSTLVSPEISTINVPRYDMGFESVNILNKLIEEPDINPIVHVLTTELIERKSTNPESENEWRVYDW